MTGNGPDDVDDLLPLGDLERQFPGGFTIRDEANALTAYAFRNGFLEDLHAGRPSELTTDSSYSRITDSEIKDLMIEASTKLSQLLQLKEEHPERYRMAVMTYNLMFCSAWER